MWNGRHAPGGRYSCTFGGGVSLSGGASNSLATLRRASAATLSMFLHASSSKVSLLSIGSLRMDHERISGKDENTHKCLFYKDEYHACIGLSHKGIPVRGAGPRQIFRLNRVDLRVSDA